MLKAYLDFGCKSDNSDTVVSVASVIFKPTHYKQFIREWNPFLKRWGASAFHATDFYNGAEEFPRDTEDRKRLFAEDSKRIPSIIGRHAEFVLIVSFRPQEFNQVATPEWKASFGTSVHSHAVQLALIANGWWREEKRKHEWFAYIMESGDHDEAEVLRSVTGMRNDSATGTANVIRVQSFTTVKKGVARGLEAADFVAWHWNKYYMDKIREGKELEPRKDFAALIASSKNKVDYIFATGEKLRFFFSLVPPEALKEAAPAAHNRGAIID